MTHSNEHNLKLYPLNGEYIAAINYQPLQIERKSCETVVILDRSGSMGGSVALIVNEILTKFFTKLDYDKNDKIHLITFDTQVEYFHVKVSEFEKIKIDRRGRTYMNLGISKFYEIFQKLYKNEISSVRVLTISDGKVDDKAETEEAAQVLAKFVKSTEISINSQAVRWKNSAADTSALCCLLQLNNVQASKLLDIPREMIEPKTDKNMNEISQLWSELFSTDGLDMCMTMSHATPIFLKYPWDLRASKEIRLVPGENIFWLKKVPEILATNDAAVHIEVADSLSYDQLQDLLKNKLDYVVDHMKILKIVDSKETHETIERIMQYFTKIEEEIPDTKLPSDIKILKNRIELIKFYTKNGKFSNTLAQIANDNMVHQLNAAQKADYLRQTEVSKNSKALARRSAKSTDGQSFDEIARQEALAIAKNIEELNLICDKDHEVSFYSQATTMEGIIMLSDFTEYKEFDECDVFEILQLLNIVGVACNGSVGDYPDASTWRINKMYPSCRVSYADILCVLTQSKNHKLMVPAIDEEITNVIPIFDDPRIGRYLKKYAPSLLEFTFSIGMRKMIAEVPKTIDYTMIAGVRAMISLLNQSKTTKNLEIFKNIVLTLENFAGKFEVEDLLIVQECGKFSYFLNNNGIADIIVPLIRLIRKSDFKVFKHMSAILRSVYNYEIFLYIRRFYKGSEHERIDMLIKLLGVDFEKNKINVEEHVDETELNFHDEINVNYSYVKELTKDFEFLNLIALIPKYLHAAIIGKLKHINKIPTLDIETLLKTLRIDYSYEDFLFVNIYQALTATSKQDRCDMITRKMKIVDTQHLNEIIVDAQSHVRELFKKKYEFEMERKNRLTQIRSGVDKDSDYRTQLYNEQLYKERVLALYAVENIINSKSYDEMIDAWRNGIKFNGCVMKILSPTRPGFRLLILALRTMSIEILMRAQIIKVLLLGVDKNGIAVWNKGKPYVMKRHCRRKYENAFIHNSSFEQWDRLVHEHDEAMKNIATSMTKNYVHRKR